MSVHSGHAVASNRSPARKRGALVDLHAQRLAAYPERTARLTALRKIIARKQVPKTRFSRKPYL